jgi:hypothetical protein
MFYYQHVSCDETKKTGTWDDDEKKLLHDILTKYKRLGKPYQFGIISTFIPNRCGRQCAMFYKYKKNENDLLYKNL